MGDFGPSMVKACVDEDIRAYDDLAKYGDEHKDIIDRYTKQVLEMGGWNIVRACADQDIEAERALLDY